MAQNEKQWSSAEPGLLVILLDKSGSMNQNYQGSETAAEFSSKTVNKVIDNIIQRSFDGEAPKNRCFISVIGYNSNVTELRSGWLKDLAEKPLRYEKMQQKIPDGTGGIITIDVENPVWIEPTDIQGVTNMKGAFEQARSLVKKWMQDYPDNPAPVIINISDGAPYYEGKDEDLCMSETVGVAREIMNLSCNDGNVLIFNAHIAKSGGQVICPSNRASLNKEEAQFLFDITSVIPNSYRAVAEAKFDMNIDANARGCVFEADGVQLIQLIDFGSSKGQQDIIR